MSFRFTPLSETKNLAIPAHAPVGAVIGKSGSYCKVRTTAFAARWTEPTERWRCGGRELEWKAR
ncbi:hypothetical protein F441_06676 [Phytophthora nicotianae CJ01A1]|uniref:K Homology domain-containing protein n=6 Tax=Phytophthora nicotianae TaxID=4792 RepID=W2RCC3_PHYN3|nr:hypothetical protein PPTG_02766 [Phytophthora nicotianae INRA-310]ETI49538.1 hypothetical protein F443_06669 [Phytophthora nicotianae P1569]ETK89416.1 hypothetical protein L915_06543 [Phytophthora nicotianae]ETO78247.1 hypothetical protein F444_06740 [Phytophthora nicotianae P1976]ETP19297.1 hypothetical protein F441_06676 [Phytophthora nicotianae CJ01A1]ETP47238.1 hypothetical protein F442_06709 [Phytophthora nicotianae P10297]